MNYYQDISNTDQVLFTLVRNVLGCEKYAGPVTLSDEDWSTLFLTARMQNVAAMTYDMISSGKNNIVFDVKMSWASHAVYVRDVNNRHVRVLRKLKDVFDDYGIRFMVLKGLGQASLYPSPLMRECGDVDIWCFGECERANDAIGSLGIAMNHVTEKHYSFKVDGANIENHIQFNVCDNKANSVVGTALDSVIGHDPLPLPMIDGVFMPNPTANALYLMIHMQNHMVWPGIKVRHLVDWTLFVNRFYGQVDWKYVVGVWSEAGLMKCVSLVFSLCGRLFDCRQIEGLSHVSESDKDYKFILNDILHPLPSPSAARNSLLRLRCHFLRHSVRRRRYEIVYDEPYPGNLVKIVWDKYVDRHRHD